MLVRKNVDAPWGYCEDAHLRNGVSWLPIKTTKRGIGYGFPVKLIRTCDRFPISPLDGRLPHWDQRLLCRSRSLSALRTPFPTAPDGGRGPGGCAGGIKSSIQSGALTVCDSG